jgi:hypothetical protein
MCGNRLEVGTGRGTDTLGVAFGPAAGADPKLPVSNAAAAMTATTAAAAAAGPDQIGHLRMSRTPGRPPPRA